MRMSVFCVIGIALAMSGAVASQDARSYEAAETARSLGIRVRSFEGPQDISAFEDLDPKSPLTSFTARKRPLTGPTPQPSYAKRKYVEAKAPDGTVYHGFSGRFDEGKVYAGPGQDSSNRNPRQRYASHHGYFFNPADVFIGRLQNKKIRTSLFFRDIGSHETAPYYFTVDAAGSVHLIVADVNISDNNELNIFSLIGDPGTGRWIDAVLLDRRGFTSRSHTWAGVSGNTVHLLWSWGDATYDKANPNMGLFYSDWTPVGYGRKVRVIDGLIESYDAMVEPKSGQLFVAVVVNEKIFLATRLKNGSWRRPAELNLGSPVGPSMNLSVHGTGAGSLVIRTDRDDRIEWLVRPR